MSALHSSSALVVNVFDHWTRNERDPLRRALGLSAAIIAPPCFERCFDHGVAGTFPHLDLDLVLDLQDGTTLAIESKFSEWLARKSPGRPAFKDKYFPSMGRLWSERKLPLCQELVENIRDGREHFPHLDAPQLLKHALGLAGCGRSFALWYLHYDCSGAEQKIHSSDLQRSRERVGNELGFRALIYQDLLSALERECESQRPHLTYLAGLKARYF